MTDEIVVVVEGSTAPEIVVAVSTGEGEQGETGEAGAAGATGAQGDPGDDGVAGAAGTDGTDGATVRSGVGATELGDPGFGNDGDFYIDTDTHEMYGPRAGAGETWTASVSLVGPTGATGVDGAAGPAGATGATGPAGADSTVPGPTGATGAAGAAGATGAAGPGVPTGGATGQLLAKTSGTDYATGWTTPAAAGGPAIADNNTPTGGLLWVPGRYYSLVLIGSGNAANAVANRLCLMPFYAHTSRAIDRLCIYCTTAGTSGQVGRLGIYNADQTTGLPTTVALDSGTFLIDSTGSKEVVVSTSINGLVWLAFTAPGGAFGSVTPAVMPSVAGIVSVSVTAATSHVYPTAAAPATSALPNMTGVGLNYETTLHAPGVTLRAA